MSITTYRDLVLVAEVAERDAAGLALSVDVRVFSSPAGEGAAVRRALPRRHQSFDLFQRSTVVCLGPDGFDFHDPFLVKSSARQYRRIACACR
jgi:hypothetical protein